MKKSSHFSTDYFTRYGWEFNETEDPDVFVCGFVDSKERSYGLVLTLMEEFITFTVPFRDLPDDPDTRRRLLTRAMRINYDLPVVKLSIDEEATLLVSIELPANSLTYEDFELALDLMTEVVEGLPERLDKADEGLLFV